MNELKNVKININYEMNIEKLSNQKTITDIIENIIQSFHIKSIENKIDLYHHNTEKNIIKFEKILTVQIYNDYDLMNMITEIYFQLKPITDKIGINQYTFNSYDD